MTPSSLHHLRVKPQAGQNEREFRATQARTIGAWVGGGGADGRKCLAQAATNGGKGETAYDGHHHDAAGLWICDGRKSVAGSVARSVDTFGPETPFGVDGLAGVRGFV